MVSQAAAEEIPPLFVTVLSGVAINYEKLAIVGK